MHQVFLIIFCIFTVVLKTQLGCAQPVTEKEIRAFECESPQEIGDYFIEKGRLIKFQSNLCKVFTFSFLNKVSGYDNTSIYTEKGRTFSQSGNRLCKLDLNKSSDLSNKNIVVYRHQKRLLNAANELKKHTVLKMATEFVNVQEFILSSDPDISLLSGHYLYQEDITSSDTKFIPTSCQGIEIQKLDDVQTSDHEGLHTGGCLTHRMTGIQSRISSIIEPGFFRVEENTNYVSYERLIENFRKCTSIEKAYLQIKSSF